MQKVDDHYQNEAVDNGEVDLNEIDVEGLHIQQAPDWISFKELEIALHRFSNQRLGYPVIDFLKIFLNHH